MPITRRRRANPPDQPENNSNHLADGTEAAGETPAIEQPSTTPEEMEQASATAAPADNEVISQQPPVVSPPSVQPPLSSPQQPVPHATNGDHPERQEYGPSIEGGRRTARGELFRRPPQPPPAQVHQVAQPAPPPTNHTQPQAPSHEITLPLGNLLHLAYNPGYTGSDEARSALLQKLTQESKNGGRARCWNCGSVAIMYDRWNTRSKTFGEVGVAICEICGVWSVM